MFLLNISLVLSLYLDFISAEVYSDYECNQPLLQQASLSATSSMGERGAKHAHLYGGNAWTSEGNNFEQYLVVDLGRVMNVTRIWTQGRPRSSEYVMEFRVSYGANGLDYSDYREPGGDIMMFKGNDDGDTVHKNEFVIPIIAQWIRINPTRWRDRISLRLELFGCEYDADTMSFNGSSLLRTDLLREPIAAMRESIKFRFKTTSPNGVLLYSRGTQGDYIALQLRENRMLLNIDLGSGLMTSLSVGSLLDDNIWHDVIISRNRRDIWFSVDRVVVQEKIKGEFNRLNLNRDLYVGGVPNIQEGLMVTQNYTGCIENLYLNSTNLLREVRDNYDAYKYERINTPWSCPEPNVVPVTFTTPRSHAKLKGYEGMSQMNASFAFRTYEPDGLMLYHSFASSGYVAVYLESAQLKVEIVTSESPRVVLGNYGDERFNDGRWHTIVVTIGTDFVIVSADARPMRTTRRLKINTGNLYYLAGGINPQLGYTNEVRPGFVGCMRSIRIDGNNKLPIDWKPEEYCCGSNEVVFEACRMTDRCNPNPCHHGGACRQTSAEFFCECDGTGYGGAVCHTAINPLSCAALREGRDAGRRRDALIDVDGSGPLAPFRVACEFYADGRVGTIVHHANEETTPVDGFQEPGTFVQDIHYEADLDQMVALINRSESCRQSIRYDCRGARLFNSPSGGGIVNTNDPSTFRPFSWWVTRNNRRADYWGGGLPGSRKCACGVLGTCVDHTRFCNCDADGDAWRSDAGDITYKEDLPVRQLRFGDTGSALDSKEGRYTLGPLICLGDDLFEDVVTFRISDATIELPPFDMGHSGDIYMEFRTASENAVLFHARGPTDFIKLSIVNGDQLQFQYQAGKVPMTVVRETSYRLADDRWHSVSVERNRKEAMLVVDGALKAEAREPPGPVRAIHLTSPFVLGASADYRDGFTGCVRALLLNGARAGLRAGAARGLYGVSEGCRGQCASSPCLNNGTCLERYDGYTCDCRWTSFKGPICADEIGVNMRSGSLVRYDFDGSFRSTISEHIRVGFTTTDARGFLLGLSSNISGEYMTVMVSNSGHLRIVFDFGFERQEVIYPEKHFGLGQNHDLRISRKDAGSTLILTVDNYEPKEFHFNIKASADAQFNNIQYLYIGRNESMTEGFVGCISRVEFDDIYPLKLLFQQEGPGNVKVLGPPLTEDYCGIEPITHPPPIIETRPPPLVDEDKLRGAYSRTDSALLGSLLGILFLVLVLVALMAGRYLHRHKGEYFTQEDAGAELAPDPDTAVALAHTGHHVPQKREWFI